MQAARMRDWEGRVCQRVRHIIAVSREDAVRMTKMFGVTNVSDVPTGVDLEYFAPPRRRRTSRTSSSWDQWTGCPT